MNALTPATTNALGFPIDGPDPFAAAAAEMGAINGHFLTFDGNEGKFEYGPKDDVKELDSGTQLVCNMATFKRGYICWNDGEVVDEKMVGVLEGKPCSAAELPDHGPYEDEEKDGWREQNSVEFRDLDTGELFQFKTTARGGLRGMKNLMDAFAKVYRTKPNQVPVVELGEHSFDAKVMNEKTGKKKSVGKKYAPVLSIVGWIPAEEYFGLVEKGDALAASDSGEAEDDGSDDPKNYAEKSGASTTAPAAEPEAEPVPVNEKVTPPAQAQAQGATGRRAKRF